MNEELKKAYALVEQDLLRLAKDSQVEIKVDSGLARPGDSWFCVRSWREAQQGYFGCSAETLTEALESFEEQ